MTNYIVLGLLLSFTQFTNAMFRGLNATNKQFPYIVSIHILDARFGLRSPYCSGSILNEKAVLTAAHCCTADLQFLSKKVLAGTTDWTKHEKAQLVDIDSFTQHPNWIGVDKLYANPDRVSVAYDACIMKLKSPGLKLNGKAKAINLGGKVPKVGTKCTVAGWGDTQPTLGPLKKSGHLMYLDIKTQSKKGCQYPPSWEARYSLDRTVNVIFEENVQICVGSKDKKAGLCHGDSGGPLVCENQLIGIACTVWESKTLDCAAGYPDIYTSVPALKDWIERQLIVNENPNKQNVKSSKRKSRKSK